MFNVLLVKTTWGIPLATLRGHLAGAKVGGQKPRKDPNHDNVSGYGILALLQRRGVFGGFSWNYSFEIDGARRCSALGAKFSGM